MEANYDQLVNLFTTKYSKMVTLQYQQGSILRGTMMEQDSAGDQRVRFSYTGKLTTKKLNRYSTVSGGGFSVESNYADMSDYTINNMILDADIPKAQNMDAFLQTIGINHQYAVERRYDQSAIDEALNTTVNATITFSNDGLADDANILKLVRMATEIGVNGSARKFYVGSAAQKVQLEQNPNYRDYKNTGVVSPAVINGRTFGNAIFYRDIYFIFMDDRSSARNGEGGLPITGTTRTNYFWFSDAAGVAVNQRIVSRAEHTLHIEGGATIFNSNISLGATIINPEGVYKIAVEESLPNMIIKSSQQLREEEHLELLRNLNETLSKA